MDTSDLIRNLFKSFHKENILYCHWKSNEHLDVSFRGDTDFDVLFDISQKAEVKRIFSENGFVLFTPPFNRRYDEIEDFIGIDYEQNRIIHFHTHYNLEIGTSGLKEYRYVIEDKVLATRIFSSDFNCYIIDPRYEFLLLIIRLTLKVRPDWKANFKNNKEIILGNIELDWLKERVSFEELLELIFYMKIPFTEEDIRKIYYNGFEYNSLYSLSTQKNRIKYLERESDLKIKANKWSKWIYFQTGRVLRKTQIAYIVKQRVNLNGGFSIAVLGSDGSGKSTQMTELKRIFSSKIDIESFYLGSNKGSRSNTRKVLEFLRDKTSISKLRVFEQLLSLSLALNIGMEKQSRLKKAKKLKHKGLLVLFDRFPQNKTYGFNDGPALTKTINTNNPIFRKIGKFEQKLYTPSLDRYPDIIFKLRADPVVLSKRRNMTLEDINRKQNGILEFSFDNKTKVIEIDANQKIEEVTSSILKEIQNSWLVKNNRER
jgi:thymidylate kinase